MTKRTLLLCGCLVATTQAFVTTTRRPLKLATNSDARNTGRHPHYYETWPLESSTLRSTDSTTVRTTTTSGIPNALSDHVRSSVAELRQAADRVRSVLGTFVAHTWWLTPLVVLCAVPLYTLLLFQCLPVTPDCWKLVDVATLLPPKNGLSSAGGFLLSNLVYFGSGGYLLFKKREGDKTESVKNLGWWTLVAGSVSTLFHSVQVVDYRLAEAFCYLDHGVAITSILYFLKTLGRPGRRTICLSALGLLLLTNPIPSLYLWCHSVWHVCSAGAALTWAMDCGTRCVPRHV